jgi:pentatricopeptide repeat protein
MNAHARAGNPEACFAVYEQMCQHSASTALPLPAATESGFVAAVTRQHRERSVPSSPAAAAATAAAASPFALSALVAACARAGRAQLAFDVLRQMRALKLPPPPEHMTRALMRSARHVDPELALFLQGASTVDYWDRSARKSQLWRASIAQGTDTDGSVQRALPEPTSELPSPPPSDAAAEVTKPKRRAAAKRAVAVKADATEVAVVREKPVRKPRRVAGEKAADTKVASEVAAGEVAPTPAPKRRSAGKK